VVDSTSIESLSASSVFPVGVVFEVVWHPRSANPTRSIDPAKNIFLIILLVIIIFNTVLILTSKSNLDN